MWDKITHHLRSARKLEICIIIALIAAMGLIMTSDKKDEIIGSDIETRIENALGDIRGVGEVNVVINGNSEEGYTGVLVVAQGIEDLSTYIRVQSAVKTLLNIELSCIEIIEMGE